MAYTPPNVQNQNPATPVSATYMKSLLSDVAAYADSIVAAKQDQSSVLDNLATLGSLPGPVLIGTTTLVDSSALLEIKAPGSADPLIRIGTTGVSTFTIKLVNSGGLWRIGSAGAADALIPGTVNGDGVLIASNTRKVVLGRAARADIMFGGGVGFNGTAPVAQSTGWSVTNFTSDKTFDRSAYTMDGLADLVCTLITYLKTRGDLAS
jgi:hypothetical protein